MTISSRNYIAVAFTLIIAVALSASERPVMRKYVPPAPSYEILKNLPQKYRVAVLPDSFDWRNVDGKNWITSVKNQGTCGACWAFASTAQFESAIKILSDHPDLPVDLSEQELVSCDETYSGCYGGNFPLDFFQKIGLVDEECFPYDTTQDTSFWHLCDEICEDANFRHNYRMKAQIIDAQYSLSAVKSAVYNTPMFFTIAIYNSFWTMSEVSDDYIWSPAPDDTIVGYHALLCVGWNDEQSCFIFKNSWGESFGADGYVKISYDCLLPSAEKPVWADGYIFATDEVDAKIIQNWTNAGFLVKSDTSYLKISTSPQKIESPLFFAEGDEWYIVQSWEIEKDFIDTSITSSGEGYFFYEDVDAPMVIEWECEETTAAATECLSSENIIVYPNPFVPRNGDVLTISFKICRDGDVSVKVFDAGYNLVRELVKTTKYSSGIYDVFWDGRADDDRMAVPGVYFIVVENLSGEFGVSKVILKNVAR